MINTQGNVSNAIEDNTTNDYFPEIIAQDKPKSALSLHLDGYRINKFLPPVALISPRGMGKSELLSALSKNLTDKDNKPKPFLHLNCASVKNLSALVEQIFIPYQNRDVTFGFDEAHLLPKEAMGWMLNVINPNKYRKSFNHHNGIRLDWDFHQTSFLFCSTNPERFSEPFISRLERVDLEEYSDLDLVKILYKNAPNINFSENVELEIVSVCRGTPREVVKLSDKIKQFC